MPRQNRLCLPEYMGLWAERLEEGGVGEVSLAGGGETAVELYTVGYCIGM